MAWGMKAPSVYFPLGGPGVNSGEDDDGGVSWKIGSLAGATSDLWVASQTSNPPRVPGMCAVAVTPVEGAPARATLGALEGIAGTGGALVVPRRPPLPLV